MSSTTLTVLSMMQSSAKSGATSDPKTSSEIVWEMELNLKENIVSKQSDFFPAYKTFERVTFSSESHPKIEKISIVRTAYPMEQIQITFRTPKEYDEFIARINTKYPNSFNKSFIMFVVSEEMKRLQIDKRMLVTRACSDVDYNFSENHLEILKEIMDFIESIGLVSDKDIREEMLLWFKPIEAIELISKFDRVKDFVFLVSGVYKGQIVLNNLISCYLSAVKRVYPEKLFKEEFYLYLAMLSINIHRLHCNLEKLDWFVQDLSKLVGASNGKENIEETITYLIQAIKTNDESIQSNLGKCGMASKEASWENYLSVCVSCSTFRNSNVFFYHAREFSYRYLLAVIYEHKKDFSKALETLKYLKDLLLKNSATKTWKLKYTMVKKIANLAQFLAKDALGKFSSDSDVKVVSEIEQQKMRHHDTHIGLLEVAFKASLEMDPQDADTAFMRANLFHQLTHGEPLPLSTTLATPYANFNLSIITPENLMLQITGIIRSLHTQQKEDKQRIQALEKELEALRGKPPAAFTPLAAAQSATASAMAALPSPAPVLAVASPTGK